MVPNILINSFSFSFTSKKVLVKHSIITKIKFASFGKFILLNKNLMHSNRDIFLRRISILFMNDFRTSPLSLGGLSFAKNSPIKYLSKPLTERRNSPNSLTELIIPSFSNVL